MDVPAPHSIILLVFARRSPVVLLVLGIFLSAMQLTLAAERYALVIGNGAYEHIDPLTNPPNDVRLVSERLRAVGFEVATLVNASKREMDDASNRLKDQLDEAGRNAIGVFYYAGHGVTYEGENWLIPVSANINQAIDIEYEALAANQMLGRMERARNATNIMILDSCRNTPYRGFSVTGTRAVSAGMAVMDAPSGSFIAYSTAPGQVAYDGVGDYSPFAEAFAAEVATPGISISDMMIMVRRRVQETTSSLGDEPQVPWDHSSLTGLFSFNPTAAAGPRSESTESVAAPARLSAESLYWESINDSTDPVEYSAYIDKYPNGDFVTIARARVERYAKPANETKAVANDSVAGYAITPERFRGVVNGDTGVFEEPDQLSHQQRRLKVGDVVQVTGRVNDRFWYQVDLGGGLIGYASMSAIQRL